MENLHASGHCATPCAVSCGPQVLPSALCVVVMVVRMYTWAEHEEEKGGAGPASQTQSGGRARGSEGSCSPGGAGWRHGGPEVDVGQDTTGTSSALQQPEGLAGLLAASQRREEASILCQVHWLQHSEALNHRKAGRSELGHPHGGGAWGGGRAWKIEQISRDPESRGIVHSAAEQYSREGGSASNPECWPCSEPRDSELSCRSRCLIKCSPPSRSRRCYPTCVMSTAPRQVLSREAMYPFGVVTFISRKECTEYGFD